MFRLVYRQKELVQVLKKCTSRFRSNWLLLLATTVFAFGILLPLEFTEQDSFETIVFAINASSRASAIERLAATHVIVVKDSSQKMQADKLELDPPARTPSQLLRC